MSLRLLNQRFDAIFSLGEQCLPAVQLERNQLRPFSGVLDWLGSQDLSKVNQLLLNRFDGFMDRKHLKTNGKASELLYVVEDLQFGLIFNHDFYTAENDPDHLEAYEQVKQKYDRRIERMLDRMQTAKNLLFIRYGGKREDVRQLAEALHKRVKHKYTLLYIEPTETTKLIVNDLKIKRVCAVEIPDLKDQVFTDQNDEIWTEILKDVVLVSQ